MARDIYQIGIDAVKYIKEQERLEDPEELWQLKDYKGKISSERYDELWSFNPENEWECDLVYPCNGCMDLVNIECSPYGFDPDYVYCGKDPHCCP